MQKKLEKGGAIMLVFWGDGSQQAKDLVSQISVRSTDHFNWTFIFILAVVFYWKRDHRPLFRLPSLVGK